MNQRLCIVLSLVFGGFLGGSVIESQAQPVAPAEPDTTGSGETMPNPHAKPTPEAGEVDASAAEGEEEEPEQVAPPAPVEAVAPTAAPVLTVADPTPAEEAKTAKYPYIFPLFAQKAVDRGYNLQLPWGVSVQMFSMVQDISIDRIALGFNDHDPVDVNFIEFGEVQSDVQSVSGRFDLWVFPFLSVYGLVGGGKSTTDVELISPISLKSHVEQTASTGGIGATLAYGYKGVFAAADVNYTWTSLEKLIDPVQGRVSSLRVGLNQNLMGHDVTIWGGAMHQRISADTSGSILLSEAIPADLLDAASGFLDTVCDPLPLAQRAGCNVAVGQIQERNLKDGVVHYNLDKSAANPVNYVVGGQFQINDSWYLRSEVGFHGRTSFMFQAQHRFGIGGF